MEAHSSFNTVLWVPRYWPAVGGTEFHTRRLAHQLCAYHTVKVVTHCNHSPGQYILPQEVALSESSLQQDGNTSIARVGTDLRYRKILFALGSHYQQQPLVRSLYQYVFNRALGQTMLSTIQGASLVHFVYNGLTDAASMAQQICEQLQIPLVLTPNVLDTKSEHSAWNSRRFIHLYKKADQIIALTTHEAEWLAAQGAPEKNISVVPYGPILESAAGAGVAGAVTAEAAADLLRKPYILYLGRMVPEKGYPLLFDAFKQICHERSDLNLVIVGNEEAEVAKQLVALNGQLGESRALFINNPSQKAKTGIIENALALCVPSSIESLGGVYIEAMACGVPVVALDLPVTRCVIDHSHDGLLTDGSVSAVKSALLYLANNPQEANAMGIRGKAKVEARYNWPRITEQIVQVYQAACESHCQSQHLNRFSAVS